MGLVVARLPTMATGESTRSTLAKINLHSKVLQLVGKHPPLESYPFLQEASSGLAAYACQKVLSNQSFQVLVYQ